MKDDRGITEHQLAAFRSKECQPFAVREMSKLRGESVVLLGSYAALSSALITVDHCLRAGGMPKMFVFNPGLYRFLQPLVNEGVSIELVTHTISVRLWRFWRWIPEAVRCRWWLRRQFGAIRDSVIHYYNDGFHLPLLAAIGYLAGGPGNRLIFEDWDHTRATGLDKTVCRAPSVWLFGRLAQVISGVPLVMLDPSAPFPNLAARFYSAHGIERCERSDSSRVQARGLPLGRLLVRQSSARLVWLWDDIARFYGQEKVSAAGFYGLYERVFAAATGVVPLDRQAVKPHPSLVGVEIPILKTGELIPAWVPMEFVEFNQPAIAITIASHAMKSFLDQGAPVISLVKMLQTSPEVIAEQDRAIKHWIEAGDRLYLPESLEEFTAILRELTSHGGGL